MKLGGYISPPHQYRLKNSTVHSFGYDNSGKIEYIFNSDGFRSAEISNNDSVFVIGNSVSFGLGLSLENIYGTIISNHLQMPLVNLSYGCYFHENHDHLHNIHLLSQRDNDDIILLQINNLDRRRLDVNTVISGNDNEFCITRFLDYFGQIQSMLKHKNLVLMYWDDIHYDIPKTVQDQILIYNKGHCDYSLPDHAYTFGQKTHSWIAKILIAKQSRLVDHKVNPLVQ
jgi:hypothetical protein